MNLRLERTASSNAKTFGKLFLEDEFECFTLEDQVRPLEEKIKGETAIPAGRYRIIVNESQRFKRRLPLLVDVPKFDGIRIHAGNTEADTKGCILVGRRRNATMILHSREALNDLIAKMEATTDEIWIEVH